MVNDLDVLTRRDEHRSPDCPVHAHRCDHFGGVLTPPVLVSNASSLWASADDHTMLQGFGTSR